MHTNLSSKNTPVRSGVALALSATLGLAAAVASVPGHARPAGEVGSQRGEQGLTYRQGDPFLFCTEGQGWKNNPTQCWIPIPPYNGGAAWMYTGICDPPNQYGKNWTQNDTRSLAEYQSVCPRRQMSPQYGPYDSKHPSHYDRQPINR